MQSITKVIFILGQSHDAFVFSQSDLNLKLQDWMQVPGCRIEDSFHIIGDSAFPCLREIMTPYKRYAAGLNDDQKKFKKHLSSKRQVRFIQPM